MRRGVLYKHDLNTDAAFEVLKIQYRDDKRVKLKVAWWNITGRFFFVGITDKVTIRREDLKRWKEIGSAEESNSRPESTDSNSV